MQACSHAAPLSAPQCDLPPPCHHPANRGVHHYQLLTGARPAGSSAPHTWANAESRSSQFTLALDALTDRGASAARTASVVIGMDAHQGSPVRACPASHNCAPSCDGLNTMASASKALMPPPTELAAAALELKPRVEGDRGDVAVVPHTCVDHACLP